MLTGILLRLPRRWGNVFKRMNINHIAKDVLKEAKGILSYEFPSVEALETYLKQHPKADRGKHWVEGEKPATGQSGGSGGHKKDDSVVETDKEQQSGVRKGKVTIPKHNLIDVQTDGDLGSVDKWKAKIQIGNSMARDKNKGDYDDVGYVAINTEGEDIIPIARSDEHQAGYDYLDQLREEGGIGSIGDYITLYKGTNYPMYSTNNVQQYAKACKRWRELGGANNPIVSQDCVTDMDEYIELGGKVPKKPDSPMKPAREILDGMDEVIRGLESRDEGVFKKAKVLVDIMEKFSSFVIDAYNDKTDEFEYTWDDIREAADSKDYDKLKKAIKTTQTQIVKRANSDGFQKEKFESLFGKDRGAKDRINGWTKGGVKGTGGRELRTDGKVTIGYLESAAKALSSGREKELRKAAERLLEHLKKHIDSLDDKTKGAIKALDKGLLEGSDGEIEPLLFGFDGLKNALHNRLRDMKRRSKKDDDYFGDVGTAFEEFERLGQI